MQFYCTRIDNTVRTYCIIYGARRRWGTWLNDLAMLTSFGLRILQRHSTTRHARYSIHRECCWPFVPPPADSQKFSYIAAHTIVHACNIHTTIYAYTYIRLALWF